MKTVFMLPQMNGGAGNAKAGFKFRTDRVELEVLCQHLGAVAGMFVAAVVPNFLAQQAGADANRYTAHRLLQYTEVTLLIPLTYNQCKPIRATYPRWLRRAFTAFLPGRQTGCVNAPDIPGKLLNGIIRGKRPGFFRQLGAQVVVLQQLSGFLNPAGLVFRGLVTVQAVPNPRLNATGA